PLPPPDPLQTTRLLQPNIIQKRVFWEGRVLEEPKLAVPGSKSKLVSKLLVRAQALSRKSVSNN
ncbi:12678_t:CDS:1, partial [Dentiscutata heterogama]